MEVPDSSAAATLSKVLSALEVAPTVDERAATWEAVAANADALAGALRESEMRQKAGSSGLAPALVRLMTQAADQVEHSGESNDARSKYVVVLTQLFRLTANYVAYVDLNRTQVLDAGLGASIGKALVALTPSSEAIHPLHQSELFSIRAATASVHNIYQGGAGFQARLRAEPKLLAALLRIGSPAPGGKQSCVHVPAYSGTVEGAMVAALAWEMLAELVPPLYAQPEGDAEANDPQPQPDLELAPQLVQASTAVLQAFMSVSPDTQQDDDSGNLEWDSEILSLASSLLQRTAEESEAVRVATLDPIPGSDTCALKVMGEFVERASPPRSWPMPPPAQGPQVLTDQAQLEDEDDAIHAHKQFAKAKGAVGKALVDAVGEDKLMDRLLQGEGGMLALAESWLDKYTVTPSGTELGARPRSDLLELSLLTLGNLARSDRSVATLAARGLGPRASSLLQASVSDSISSQPGESKATRSEDTRVAFGALRLISNLAIAPLPELRAQLIQGGTVRNASKLLTTPHALASLVQSAADSVIKLLARDSTEAAVQVASPSGSGHGSIVLSLVSLAAQTDDTRCKTEATRAVGLTVRSVLRPDAASQVDPERIEAAKLHFGDEGILQCLVGMVVDGQKGRNALIEAEGILALTLIASHVPHGADKVVLQLVPPSSNASPGVEALSTIITPSSNPSFPRPDAVRANACALVVSLLKYPPMHPEDQADLSELTAARCSLANGLVPGLREAQSNPEPVGPAAQAALQVAIQWAMETL